VQRQLAKSKAVYSNSSWDLVDAKNEGVDVGKLDAKDLPVTMQKMTKEQRKAYVEQNARQRTELQSKMRKLEAERQKFVAQAMKKSPAKSTLDSAVISVVRDAGAKKGYRFP
jgi:tRNA uridine 5-carbamoylmethylation protein Kti12